MNIKNFIANIPSAINYLKGVVKAKEHVGSEYIISFTREDNGRWYVDLPNWKGPHSSLEMVAGADDMLELIGNSAPHVTLCVIKKDDTNEKIKADMQCIRTDHSMTGGATYKVYHDNGLSKMWLCPVTLFVLGEYPKVLYIRKIANLDLL